MGGVGLGFCLSFLFVWLFNSNSYSLIPGTWNEAGPIFERGAEHKCVELHDLY